MEREEIRSQLLAEQATDKKWKDGTYQVNAVHYWFERCISERLASRKVEEELKKEKETREELIWNLGGVSTLATSRTPMEFNADWARDALWDTLKLVKDYVELQAKAASEYRRGVEDTLNQIRSRLGSFGIVPSSRAILCNEIRASLLPPDNPQQEVKP